MVDRDKVYELSLQGYNAREISKMIGEPYEYTRGLIKRQRKKHGTSRDYLGNQKTKETHLKKWEKGVLTFEDAQEISKGENITAEEIMLRNGLDVDEWEVVSFTKNVWQQQGQDGEVVDLCQSKLTVKPRKFVGLTEKDVEELFEHKFKPMEFKPIKYNIDGEILQIDVADAHVGLLAWRYESGADYDLHICCERFLAGINDIVERSRGRKFKKIYLCTLGDVLHVDNMASTTTKGTVQQSDGRITKIVEFAYDMMNTALLKLRELNAPIEYVYLCGNHDTVVGFCLVKWLEGTNPDITFDTLPNPQKAIHFGSCLIGLTHGDMPKYNKGQWLFNDYRKEFGESNFVEEHSGHIHTEEAKKYNGVMVRSVLAQCGNSYWEHQQGYRSQRGIQCFVWNEDKGLRETWYYYY